ncbi:MAG: ABC transporter substrate-binding protein [Opitutales bacterium]|nr:ABC transporter substrate-binding protein [Opitutales bacterium]
MSTHFKDPLNPNIDVWSECGENAAGQTADPHAGLAPDEKALLEKRRINPANRDEVVARALESAAMKGIFRNDINRRTFLRRVGVGTAAALVAQFFPFGSLQAMASDAAKNLEKKRLRIGFVPITCATPIVAGHGLGFYQKYGLDVEIIKTAGWAVSRDNCLNGNYDGSHLLFPMPQAMSLGLGSTRAPWRIVSNVNTNGQAIVLSNEHRDKRDPKQWKGMRFAVPFEYSLHNFLLRMVVADAGLDPDRDIQIRVVPPPEMVANLRAGNVDGYLAPDPFCQRAVFDGVGFIHKLTMELWDQHPCCVFSTSQRFIDENPNTFMALSMAILEATAMAELPQNRAQFAEVMAPRNYLNQPVEVLRQILTGIFPDGLGNVRRVPDRISFMPFPSQSMSIWVLSQMKRWGYIREEIDYTEISRRITLSASTEERMRKLSGKNPEIAWRDLPEEEHPVLNIHGRRFDPADVAGYLNKFEIRRDI